VEQGLAKSVVWNFTVVDITNSIIGADLLRDLGLFVDIGRKCLMDAETYL